MDTEYTDDIRDMIGSLGGNLNVITGINGSGKTKLLDYIWNNPPQSTTTRSNIHKTNILYKKISNVINYKPTNTIYYVKDMIDNLTTVYNIEDWSCSDLPSYIANHLLNIEPQYNFDILIEEMKGIATKQDYEKFLTTKIEQINFSIIHIIHKINELIRVDIRDINNEYADRNSGHRKEYLYEKINKKLENLRDLFKYKIKKHTSGIDFTNSYKIYFDKSDDETLNILYESLSTGEQVIFELICYKYFQPNNQIELLLLDEFDAFLNPASIKEFIETLRIFCKDVTVIVTTHNPSTVAYCKEEEVFWMENGEVLQGEKRKTKQEILANLLPGVLANIGGSKSDPYLYFAGDATKEWYIFVEGATDIEHFKNACKSLGYNNILENCNFLQFFGTKNTDCYNMMKNFTNKGIGRKAIAIFDYDKSGMEEFNKFNCQKPKDEQCDKHKKSNDRLHAIRLIPASNNEFILPAKYGYIPIELLYKKKLVEEFFNYEDETRKLFTQCEIDNNLPDEYYIANWRAGCVVNASDDVWKLINKEEDDLFIKDKFAKHITENISNIDFSGFKETLDAINSIINKEKK